jgi:AcrR family transcriptional regulator
MSDLKSSSSPAGASVRARLVRAFSEIMLSRPKGRPRMGEVVEQAGVARSTLYEHFGGRDDLLLEAMRHPLSELAKAGAGMPDEDRLTDLLAHLRGRRADTVALLDGPLKPRILRVLSNEIRAHDPDLAPAAALQLSGVMIELVRLWINGDTPAAASVMAGQIARAAVAQRSAIGTAM